MNERGLPIFGSDASETGNEHAGQRWSNVPWRSILAAILMVLAVYVAVELILLTSQLIALIVLAGFFAIVLAPAVRKVAPVVGGRRAVATTIVVFSALGSVVGVIALFLLPVRTQLIAIITDLPGTIRDAGDGNGTIGRIVTRLHLSSVVKSHEAALTKAAAQLSGSTFTIVKTAVGVLIAIVTVTVMVFLFLSQAEPLGKAALSIVPIRHRESVRTIAIDAAGAVSGYMIGNLLISLIAGIAAFLCLLVLGVPGALVIALWVAFADLIPLVGATLGAIVGVIAAFLQGTTPGVITLIFFVVYQQIENGVLYPAIMSRKVNVNPLLVLLSVLVAVQLFGFIGALLAVPASGAMLIVAKAARTKQQTAALIVPIPETSPGLRIE
ncbi:MAG: AI-2E family transporter [Ilumatobacteraceae bacterium]